MLQDGYVIKDVINMKAIRPIYDGLDDLGELEARMILMIQADHIKQK